MECHDSLAICATGAVVEVAMGAETGAGITIETVLGLTDINMVETDRVLTERTST